MSGTLAAQPVPQPANVVSLEAAGQVEVEQDLISLTLSTTVDGPEAASVQAQLRSAVDAALTAVKPLALTGALDVRTGQFSLYPRHGRDGRIQAWAGTAEVVLEGKDVTRVAAASGRVRSLTVGQVGFRLSREKRQEAEAQAQALAIERFKARADQVARGFGFTGYSLREIHVGGSDQVAPMFKARAMASDARVAQADAVLPVEAGKTTVSVTVNGSVQLTR